MRRIQLWGPIILLVAIVTALLFHPGMKPPSYFNAGTLSDSKPKHPREIFPQALSPGTATKPAASLTLESIVPKQPEAPFNPSELLPTQSQVLCELRKLPTSVPIRGKVQVIADLLPPFDESADRIAWIKSPDCPKGLYSIVRFGPDGKPSFESDCRTASLTEIALYSSMQGDVAATQSRRGLLNLAILGPGHFLLRCPKGNYLLTRNGEFKRSWWGEYENKDGCIALNAQGESFHLNGTLGSNGCTEDGECLAVVDPASEDVFGVRYKSTNSFTAEDVDMTGTGVKRDRASKFVVNALEELANEEGPTSVSWKYEKNMDLEILDCPVGARAR